MSASLVGSEMCIRDSAGGARGGGGRKFLQPPRRGTQDAAGIGRTTAGSCLLYTSDAADDM
eukprot:11423447-Alexandrium_andersonii.AAC.1